MIGKKTILIVILLLIVAGVTVFTLFSTPPQEKCVGAQCIEPPKKLTITEVGVTGNNAYAIYSAAGSGQLKFVLLNNGGQKKVYILDQKGIGTDKLNEFINKIMELKKYGFEVSTVGPAATVKNGILIIPTGAMPEYILDQVTSVNNVTYIYIGETDLLIKTTTKEEEWYEKLPATAKKKLIIVNSTVDALLANGITKLSEDIIANQWAVVSEKELVVSGQNGGTLIIPWNNGNTLRAIANFNGYNMVIDQNLQNKLRQITPDRAVFPWEDAWVEFSLSKTNGTAYLNIEKNGELMKSEKLERVTEESVFRKKLQFDQPGKYILKVIDNGGVVANGLLTVKNLSVTLKGVQDEYYTFSFEIDGVPIKEGTANVSIKDSASGMVQTIAISDGTSTVHARLPNGKGIMVFSLMGGKAETPLEYKQENVTDVYVKYGPFGVLLIILVYLIATLNKKQTYTIRIGEVAPEIRKEIKITSTMAEQFFKYARRDLKIDGPLKPHEFAVGLKRYVTEGADVTEGNVEEILKKMGGRGIILSWLGYYQLTTDGNIKRNVMKRIIREKLIERGIQFKINEDKFITRDFEIGFFDSKFRKKAIVVFEDSAELKKEILELGEKERSKLFLKEFNGVLNLIPIEKLDDAL